MKTLSDLLVIGAAVVVSGSTDIVRLDQHFTSDGTADVAGLRVQIVSDGQNHVSQAIAGRFVTQHTGAGTITTARGVLGEVRLDGPANVDGAIGVSGLVSMSNSGSIGSSLQTFRAASPDITGTGTAPAAEGLRISNHGHPNIGDVYALRVQDQSGSPGYMIGGYFEMSAGPGKYNIYVTGSAPSVFAGPVYFGNTIQMAETTAPTPMPGAAQMYLENGAVKVMFDNGVVKTLATR